MNAKEQTSFFKRLAFLINAQVPLSEALHLLATQTSVVRQKNVYNALLSDVIEGQSFSRACKKFPHIFSAFCVSMLMVGEESGTLASTLDYVALALKKKQALRSKVFSAFIYPAVITCATIGITLFLILFLFPKITPIFKSMHTTLPLSTRVVMTVSTFLAHYGFLLVIGLILLGTLFIVLINKSIYMRMLLDTVSFRMPLTGGMLQGYALSNLSRTLGLLLTSGLPLSRGLLVTAEATPNMAYKSKLIALQRKVNNGEKMSVFFSQYPKYFPQLFCHMVAVGERSGTLSETLLYLAELYDSEVDERTKNISTLIEPILMVGMGVLVGFIAISIITPIYGITQTLHN